MFVLLGDSTDEPVVEEELDIPGRWETQGARCQMRDVTREVFDTILSMMHTGCLQGSTVSQSIYKKTVRAQIKCTPKLKLNRL